MLLILLTAGLFGVFGMASAQAQTPVTPGEINEVARALWCPLCNGVRLDTCELKACEQMREVIGIKLAQGESLDQIRDYFVAQYGPQVLGEPPRQGISWLAWLLPFVALAAAGVWVVWLLRRWTRAKPVTAAAAPGVPANLSGDQLSRLEEELKKID
jgi:cytochrome c-type biogenesis protein CcmH